MIKDLLQTYKHPTSSKSALTFRSPQRFRLDNMGFMQSPNPGYLENIPKTEPSFEKTPVLRPKSPYPEKSSEVMYFIETQMRNTLEITEKELETLRNIIVVQKNEMILSSFEVFQSNRDEEDFYDTIRRILSKIRGKSDRPSDKDPAKPSYFVSQRPGTAVEERKTPKQEEQRPKTSQVSQDNRPKVPELKPKIEPPKQQETVIRREELPKKAVEEVPKKKVEPQIQPQTQQPQRKPEPKAPEPPKKQEAPAKKEERKVEENKPQNTPNPKKNMLDLIFKTFFEETEEEFEPIEIGFAKYLYESGDGDLINVLNTCETIPKAVILIKDLAVKAYTQWLNDNFEEKQREYVLKNRNERSSEICSIIHVFPF